MSRFSEYVYRKKAEYGPKFDPSDLAPQFAEHLHSGQRIRVRTVYKSGEFRERTGTVGVTTGWRPAFLLIARSNAFGSSDVLDKDDVITAIKIGRKYRPVDITLVNL